MKMPVQDAGGKVIGYLLDNATRITAQDKSGQTLGWFDKNSEKTFDKSGKPLYSGDMTRALFRD